MPLLQAPFLAVSDKGQFDVRDSACIPAVERQQAGCYNEEKVLQITWN